MLNLHRDTRTTGIEWKILGHRRQDGNVAVCVIKKNLNASRLSEHPPVRGENVKTFRWDNRLQIQNLMMAFKRVPLWS